MKTFLLALGWACLVMFPAFSQSILYVKEGANGTGYSWNSPLGNLQKALHIALPHTEIWIAEGTYYPVACKPCTEDQRNLAFDLPKNIKLFGGFQGFETNRNDRQWMQHPTILSGNIGREDALDNSRTVVRILEGNNLLDGLYISDGYAEGSASGAMETSAGAGLFYHPTKSENDKSLIQNCILTSNFGQHGAAVFIAPTEEKAEILHIERTRFIKNKAAESGGALLNANKVVLNQCQFVGNEAGFGGAVFSYLEAHPESWLLDCAFVGNQSDYGGALFFLSPENRLPSLSVPATFKNNTASEGKDIYTHIGKEIPRELLRARMQVGI